MQKIPNDQLGRMSVEEFRKAEKLPFVFLLDNIRSMNNIGSIFRTADAFRFECMVLCGISATPPHREIHKSALGAEDSVQWSYDKDTETAAINLKNAGYVLVGVEQTTGGVSLNGFTIEKEKKYAFVLGHEIHGVSEAVLKHCDLCVEIPQLGTKHSLNVAVTAGIVAYHVAVISR